MKNFLNSLGVNISIFFEILKSFIIMCLVVVAIFVTLSSIVHNAFKIRELYDEDLSGYKNLVVVGSNRMNVQVVGEGEKTIVILSSFAMPSPIVQYKAYADRLVNNGYRVVVIEYFGYGYSLSTKDSRNVGYFVHEIDEALQSAQIYGTYTILANGTSGLYAESYANAFPDKVEKLILVDSIYPETIKEDYIKKQIEDDKFNITLTSYAELTGYARLLSYIKPEMFGIDKMQELGFSNSDISFFRKMIANRFYTKTMRNEYKELASNMETFKDYKFPDYLNVLQILSSDYIKEYEEYKTEKFIKKDLKEYANDLITNQEIQKVITITGEKENLNLSNPNKVIEAIISE